MSSISNSISLCRRYILHHGVTNASPVPGGPGSSRRRKHLDGPVPAATADLAPEPQMILQMHAPEMAGNAEVTKAMQKQLIEVQKTDQAWGLTEGLLHHPVSLAAFLGHP